MKSKILQLEFELNLLQSILFDYESFFIDKNIQCFEFDEFWCYLINKIKFNENEIEHQKSIIKKELQELNNKIIINQYKNI